MDYRANKLNIVISISFRIIQIISIFFLRRVFLACLGIELQGLTSVFTGILGFLGIADLGIGVAINYAMYKPISDGNQRLIGALYGLYRKIYFIVGLIIFLGGVSVVPFLKGMCNGYNGKINIYFAYFLSLAAAVFSYVYAADSSLISAHQYSYVSTLISSGSRVVQSVAELICLVLFRSYYLYLFLGLVFSFIQFFVFRGYVNNHFKGVVFFRKEKTDSDTLNDIVKNVKALIYHKIGAIAVFNMDSIIISTMLGVAVLGYYSNYQTILVAEVGIISLFITPLTAGIGSLIAEKNKKTFDFYQFMHQINFSVGFVCFFITYIIIDYGIYIWLGAEYIMERKLVLVFVINFFVDFMRKSNLVFKDAAGLFYPDRYKCIVEALINLSLSIYLCKKIGFIGVIVATIVTNLSITLVVEPLVVFKHLFKKSAIRYFVREYTEIAVFVAFLLGFDSLSKSSPFVLRYTVINAMIGLVVSIVLVAVVSMTNKGFRNISMNLIKRSVYSEQSNQSDQTTV